MSYCPTYALKIMGLVIQTCDLMSKWRMTEKVKIGDDNESVLPSLIFTKQPCMTIDNETISIVGSYVYTYGT